MDHVTATAAQLAEIRTRLLAEAAAAELDPDQVAATIDGIAQAYLDARVRSFVGILVERDVRKALQLTRRPA